MTSGEQPYRAIGQQLDAVRESRGLSREDFAHLLNVSPRTLHRYVTGERLASAKVLSKAEQIGGLHEGSLALTTANAAAVPPSPAAPTAPTASTTEVDLSSELSHTAAISNPEPRSQKRQPWESRKTVGSGVAVLLALIGGIAYVTTRSERVTVTGRIVSPTAGEAVDYPTGPIAGTVSNLGTRALWLAQHRTDEDGLHPYNDACKVTGDRFTCEPAYLGRKKADHGRTFVLVLLAADPNANRQLEKRGDAAREHPDQDAYRPIVRPRGAQQLTQITVTRR